METLQELYEEYKKIFILVIETAGDKTGNRVYKEVENIIKDNERHFQDLIEDDVPFKALIAAMEFMVITKIRSVEELEQLGEEKVKDLVDSMFDLYLKRPTRKFTSTHGLPPVDELSTYITIILTNRKRNEEF